MASSSTNRRGKSGIERVLGKLTKCIEDGNYYEALQMYRTIYFRYKTQQKYPEAIDLLYEGAMVLLKHQQHSGVTDLSLLLLEALSYSSLEPTQDYITKVGHLYEVMPIDAVERPQYIQLALQWTINVQSANKFGHPDLHQSFAHTAWHEQNYKHARYHFLHSNDGSSCASLLVEIHKSKGYSTEVDLFIAQAVFQYLCLRNRATALTAFNCFTKQHPQIEEGPPYVLPLLNFLWFLLLAVESGKVAVFSILCEHYRPMFKRDPAYLEYLDRIGQIFFGIPPPKKTGGGGMFGNMMSNLFSAGDESEDELNEDSSSRSTSVNCATIEVGDLD